MSASAQIKTQNSKIKNGFSLVEIMIVIVIIGMLASVVTINVRGYLTRAKQATAKQEIATIVKAIDTFHTVTGRVPTNEEKLDVLARPSPQFSDPPLNATQLRDPWGTPYDYITPGQTREYEVISYGAKGQPGGSGAEEDISSDDLRGDVAE